MAEHAAEPYAAPARATDLSGLPPAYIEVGSAETFRDEHVAYANARPHGPHRRARHGHGASAAWSAPAAARADAAGAGR
ncbi:alpha/beta hydrolase fold domain-containing protein [Streptomyces sp. NPDC059949]|uniref:alpha/beta hydrolase fold domain-containing protein n=1 Tax=Streptomyces sp. NPDC059949 TaxID=3347013 RepID=UPI00364EA538